MTEEIDRVAGDLMQASVDPAAWGSALDRVNRFLNSSGVVILSIDERLRHAPSSSDLLEMMDDYFSSGWHAKDRRDACVPLMLKNGIVRDYEVLSIEEIENYQAEFLARHKRKWFAGLCANLDGHPWCLAAQRSVDKGAFLDEDLPRLAAVRARLEEAASYSRIASQQWLDGALCALDSENSAALIVDRAGQILHISRAAHSIVYGSHAGSGLAHRDHRKSFKTFQERLRSALCNTPAKWGHAAQTSLEFDGKSYVLEVTSLIGKASLVFSKASLLLFLRPHAFGAEYILKTKYRLTQSELRVAMALADGLDVKTMAEVFAVRPSTIRVQLKAVYGKTDTRGQSKLVALISRLK